MEKRLFHTYMKIKKTLSKLSNQNGFLLRCRSQGYLPAHIINSQPHINFSNPKGKGHVNQAFIDFKIRILKREITNVNFSLRKAKREIEKIESKLLNIEDNEPSTKHFFECQNKLIYNFEKEIIEKSAHKFKWLTKKYTGVPLYRVFRGYHQWLSR